MTKSPFYNAVLALGYVSILVLIINFVTKLAGPHPDNTIMAPIAMLSLLTLSAAVMAYLFFYEPLLLLLDGKRKEAVQLFLSTVAIFAGITLCIVLTAFVLF